MNRAPIQRATVKASSLTIKLHHRFYLTSSIAAPDLLTWFEVTGYTVLLESDIFFLKHRAERSSYTDLVLANRLHRSLQRINPSIPSDAIALNATHLLRDPMSKLKQADPRLWLVVRSAISRYTVTKTLIMKTGIFCNYENYYQDARRAISEQVALVKHAESLMFEEAWVTEHHFNEVNLSPSILVLMAHLAGVTSSIHLGSAAVLPAFHDPIIVAEDIATLDNLCNGRLAFGIAKGGPFPEQNKHFATPKSESRAKMLEAMALIHKLLYEVDVSFNGQYYHCDQVTIYPKPLQPEIPVYVATSDDDAIGFAAARSFGLMGAPPFSLDRLKSNVTKYRTLNSSGSEQLMLARFFFVARTYDEAVSEALPFIRTFGNKMKALTASQKNHGNDSQKTKPPSSQKSVFDEDYLLLNSIIGDVATCRDKVKRFQDELNLGTLALKPSSLDLQKNLESLTRYNQEVRSYV